MADLSAIAKAYRLTSAEAAELARVARSVGADAGALANLIQFESGWNPRARNPTSGATGLIQFMPKTAARLGTSTSALARLDRLGQLAYVERYLSAWRGKLGTPYALYMSVFYPVAIGWHPSQMFNAAVRKANPGINTPADYVRLVEKKARVTSARALALVPTPSRKWAYVALLLLAAGGAAAYYKYGHRARRAA